MFYMLLLIKLTFDYIYYFILRYDYGKIELLKRGFNRGAFQFNFNFLIYLITTIISLFFIYFFSKYVANDNKTSTVLFSVLFLIGYFPCVTLMAFSSYSWSYLIYFHLYWLWFMYIFVKIKKIRLKTIVSNKIFNKKNSKILFYLITSIFILISVGLAYKYYGKIYIEISFSNDNVYENRLAARGAFGTISNIVRNNCMYAVFPIVIVYLFNKKKISQFIVILFAIFIVYSVDSQKASMLIVMASLLLAFFIKKNALNFIIRGILLLNITCIVLYSAFDINIFLDYLFKRIYFLPAIITQCQFDYVNTNGFVVMFSSILSKIGLLNNYIYNELQLPFAIGLKYFGSAAISSNTGGFAAAYVYGPLGILVTPIIYSLLFKLLNDVTKNLDLRYSISIIVSFAYLINGASLPAVILIYGYLLAIFLLLLLNYFESNLSSNLP